MAQSWRANGVFLVQSRRASNLRKRETAPCPPGLHPTHDARSQSSPATVQRWRALPLPSGSTAIRSHAFLLRPRRTRPAPCRADVPGRRLLSAPSPKRRLPDFATCWQPFRADTRAPRAARRCTPAKVTLPEPAAIAAPAGESIRRCQPGPPAATDRPPHPATHPGDRAAIATSSRQLAPGSDWGLIGFGSRWQVDVDQFNRAARRRHRLSIRTQPRKVARDSLAHVGDRLGMRCALRRAPRQIRHPGGKPAVGLTLDHDHEQRHRAPHRRRHASQHRASTTRTERTPERTPNEKGAAPHGATPRLFRLR